MEEAIQGRLAVGLQDTVREGFSFSLGRENSMVNLPRAKPASFPEGVFRVPTAGDPVPPELLVFAKKSGSFNR